MINPNNALIPKMGWLIPAQCSPEICLPPLSFKILLINLEMFIWHCNQNASFQHFCQMCANLTFHFHLQILNQLTKCQRRIPLKADACAMNARLATTLIPWQMKLSSRFILRTHQQIAMKKSCQDLWQQSCCCDIEMLHQCGSPLNTSLEKNWHHLSQRQH